MSEYHEHLSAAVAHEHVADLLRSAQAARQHAAIPRRHHVSRFRLAWWNRVTTGATRPITA